MGSQKPRGACEPSAFSKAFSEVVVLGANEGAKAAADPATIAKMTDFIF